MVQKNDIAFARTVLKKGWLSKEELEEALREVQKVRQNCPDMTLSKYLGVKEKLSWDQISAVKEECEQVQAGGGEQAASVSRTRQAATAHHHTARSHTRSAGTGRHHSSHSRATHAHGRADGAHHGHHTHTHFHRKKKNNALVGGIVLGSVLGVGLIVVIIVFLNRPSTEPEGGSGRKVAEKTQTSGSGADAKLSEEEKVAVQAILEARYAESVIEKAEKFLSSFPRSSKTELVRKKLDLAREEIEQNARNNWKRESGKFPELRNQRRFSEIDDKCAAFIRSYEGTAAVKEAREMHLYYKRMWEEDYHKAFIHIEQLIEDHEITEAKQSVIELASWCPEKFKAKVAETKSELQRHKEPEVAMVDTTDSGDKADGADNAGKADKEEPKDLAGFFPGADEEIPEGAGGGSTPVPQPGLDDGQGKDSADHGTTSVSGEEDDPKKSDTGGGLFAESDEDKPPAENPVAELIKKHGLEKVKERLKLLFHCTNFDLNETGRVKVGYAFYKRSENLGVDWKPSPTPATSMKSRVRWSADWEGDLETVVQGVRISENAIFANSALFFHDAEIEVRYHNAQLMKPGRTHLITGLFLPKSNLCCGVDVGNNAVKVRGGRIVDCVPRRRGEMVPVGKLRWFKMEYHQGKVIASTAYGQGRSGGIIISGGEESSWYWDAKPTYRKYGELKVNAKDEHFRMGVLFFPDIVGTIEYIRMGGYLSPEWFKENRSKLSL